jgi:phosphatidylserine decarboxylase
MRSSEQRRVGPIRRCLTAQKAELMKKNYGRDRPWIFAEGGETTILAVVAIVLGALVLWLIWPDSLLLDLLLFAVAIAAVFILYFFRDPNRRVAREPQVVVAPADGKVVAIVEEHEPVYLKDSVCRMSIFLSVFDVHVQRAPVQGEVVLVEHRPGAFLQAFRPEASDVNEFVAMIINSKYGRVMVKQIAGILARRCVNYAEVGETLAKGQRFGLIKFGSRVDLFLPPGSRFLVQVGDQVYAGLTPVARLGREEDHEQ